MLDALIFDLDGTLVDTNGLHARAWETAFRRSGFAVSADEVLPQIGQGGELLVPALVGEEAAERCGEELREAHGEAFLDLLDQGAEVPVLPRVEELLRELRRRGVERAVATASRSDHLERVLERAGLDLDALVDALVDDDDVDRPKPRPDVVSAAVGKLGLPASACAMVGDTPYDMQAAGRAGVLPIGVLTGVHPEPAMRQAGAVRCFRDPADLLARLDEALEASAVAAAG